MEMSLSYPASKFEADNTLTNPIVLEKYQLAADIVNGRIGSCVNFDRSCSLNFFIFFSSCPS